MSTDAPTVADIRAALAPFGMIPRGGFAPRPQDGVPARGDGTATACVVMVGNAGPDMWHAFSAARAAADPPFDARDPMDDWTVRVLAPVAEQLGMAVVYPFGGPPWLPFLRWSARAEASHVSPLGMAMHPDHGLWHAFRGAFLLNAVPPDLPRRDGRPSPCDDCADRPCLSTCPVDAFAGAALGAPRYDAATCRAHLATEAGRDCVTLGCRARRACPVAPAAVWPPAQAQFHMESFRRAGKRG